MKEITVTEARTRLSELVREVQVNAKPVAVTRSGRPAAVLVDDRTFRGMAQTLHLLDRSDMQAAIQEGIEDADIGALGAHEELFRCR